ncbi:MAG: HAD-IA family hydrolase [SAR324 cluster bacterium]|nr:HAD-IA family hydrolase [SAR324 cluster bacterium]
MYLHLLNSFNLQAEETVFIDDRQDNIEAAEKLGINGIRFTSPGQLKEELRNLEIF